MWKSVLMRATTTGGCCVGMYGDPHDEHIQRVCSNQSSCRPPHPLQLACSMAFRGFTVMSTASDDESAVHQTHTARGRALGNGSGDRACRIQRPVARANGRATPSGEGGSGPAQGFHGPHEGRHELMSAPPHESGSREHGREDRQPHDGTGGGATPRAAAAPRVMDPQSAHDLGLSMGIPENVLTAVELQSAAHAK